MFTVLRETHSVTRIGQISTGLEVNINFEEVQGQTPQRINANCRIVTAEATEGVPAKTCFINITHQASGEDIVNLNGNDTNMVELAPIIEEIKGVLNTIATEGGQA